MSAFHKTELARYRVFLEVAVLDVNANAFRQTAPHIVAPLLGDESNLFCRLFWHFGVEVSVLGYGIRRI